MDSYICYKKEYECEDYLLLVRDYKLRMNISKLRLSSHCLNIEVGRHTRPKVERKNRVCKLCNNGVIEDEEHFVMACPVYQKEREHLFTKILFFDEDLLVPNCQARSFINMMSIKEEIILFYLGKFITKCFKIREELLTKM